MNIKRRIWALPLISTVIFGIGLALIVYFVTNALSSIATTEEIDYPTLDQSKSLALEIRSVANGLKDAVGEGDKARLEVISEQASKVRERIKTLGVIPGQAMVAERVAKEFEEYYVPALSAARIMLEVEEGDPQSAIAQMQTALPVLEADLAKNNDAAQKKFKFGIVDSNNNIENILRTSILVAVVVISSLIIISFFVVRSIWMQLGGEPEYACAIAHAVAAGDLTKDISIAPGDTVSVLAALRVMQGNLGGIVAGIKSSSETIKLACHEIASGNADLSARTELQSSSLANTASSMEKLTDTVRQNAGNSQQASRLVASASEVAVKGGEVVNQVVTTMAEINDSSKKITDIISVIDGIAFQTNILALNAAVEAARAGEQGRGFAVVAAEVRNLAQRSAAAAKEIKLLINSSVEKVDVGSRLVNQAGQTMDEIVVSVKHVTQIMHEIANATSEQTSGIEQVNMAINQMDDVTQQNAMLVEQAAATAGSMQDQASNLVHAVSIFKLRAHKPASTPPLLTR